MNVFTAHFVVCSNQHLEKNNSARHPHLTTASFAAVFSEIADTCVSPKLKHPKIKLASFSVIKKIN